MSHRQDHLAYGQYYEEGSDRGQQGGSARGLVGDTFNMLKTQYKNHSSSSGQQSGSHSGQQQQSQNYGQGGYGNQGPYDQNAPPNYGSNNPGQSTYQDSGYQGRPGKQDKTSGGLFGKLQGAVADIGGELAQRLGTAIDPHGYAEYGAPKPQSQSQHRFGSFAPARQGNDVQWYVDGCAYFYAVSKALETARESIWILDWWLSPEVYLRRPPAKNEQYRLDRMLQAAAQRGVKVNIIVYKEVTQALTLSSSHTKHHLEGLHQNIAVFRHPDHLPDRGGLAASISSSLQNLSLDALKLGQMSTDAVKGIYGMHDDVILYWAHHEKLCLVDGTVAFMGGLDLCYGRWDTHQHAISDVHDNPNDNIFTGQEYNNARVLDFSDVAHPDQNKLDRTKTSRMGWSDISVSLHGYVVQDLRTHFAERWNFIYDTKYQSRNDARFARIALPGRPVSSSGQQNQRPPQQGAPQQGAPQQVTPQQGAPQQSYNPSQYGQSTQQKPGYQQPEYQKPNNQKQDYQKPDYQQSGYQQPSYQKPDNQKPDHQQPGYQQPSYQQSEYQKPDSQKHDYQQPSYQQPSYQQSESQKPDNQKHDYQPPSYQQPSYQQSDYQKPDSQKHDYQPPSYQQSDYQKHDYQQPNYQKPEQQQASHQQQEYSGQQHAGGYSSQQSYTYSGQSFPPPPPGGPPSHSYDQSQAQPQAQSQAPSQPSSQAPYFPPPPTQDQPYGQSRGGINDYYEGAGDGDRERGPRPGSGTGSGSGSGFVPRRFRDNFDNLRGELAGQIHQYQDRFTGSAVGRPQQQRGNMSCQILRSCTKWSNGTPTEHSIQDAYIQLIENSEYFIYIENQFFITATGDAQKPVKNKIGAAIVERILRAACAGQKYKIIVVIPTVPCFAGDLSDEAALGTRAIMEFQYNSINRGGNSIMELIAKEGYNPMEYIRFYNLRNYDRIKYTAPAPHPQYGGNPSHSQPHNRPAFDTTANYQPQQQPPSHSPKPSTGQWDSVSACYMLNGPNLQHVPWDGPSEAEVDAFVTEELYVHSKVMIADDRVVICGSANLNDRSQLGEHDSEIAVLIEDMTPVQSTMDGRPWTASRFATSLRRHLFRKHLGLLAPQNIERPLDETFDLDAPESRIVADPLADTFHSLWNTRARTNTEVFREVFHVIPDDMVRSWVVYKEFYGYYFKNADKQAYGEAKDAPPAPYKYGHVVSEKFPGPEGVHRVKELLSQVKGTLVEMPLMFLCEEDVAESGLALNDLTEPLYT